MTCQLITNGYSVMIQMLLGLISFSSLWVKRQLETEPKRDYVIFLFDVSKQAFGLLVAHGFNVAISEGLSRYHTNNDPCVWYFVNYLIDVLGGLPLNYLGIYLLRKYSKRCGDLSWQSGHYEEIQNDYQLIDNPSTSQIIKKILKVKSYWKQLASWILIIMCVKIILAISLLVPFHRDFFSLGHSILSPVADKEGLELVIVMLVVPITFNVIQYWIQDNFLMFRGIAQTTKETNQTNRSNQSNRSNQAELYQDDSVDSLSQSDDAPYVDL